MAERKEGQIAIEFLMYVGIAFFVVLMLMATIVAASKNNTQARTYADIDDLGKSLQQEFLLAAKLEDGYTRRINLPTTINGKEYNVTLGQSNPTNSYMMLGYGGSEWYYLIPSIVGNISFGNNVLHKENDTLYLGQT